MALEIKISPSGIPALFDRAYVPEASQHPQKNATLNRLLGKLSLQVLQPLQDMLRHVKERLRSLRDTRLVRDDPGAHFPAVETATDIADAEDRAIRLSC